MARRKPAAPVVTVTSQAVSNYKDQADATTGAAREYWLRKMREAAREAVNDTKEQQ